MLLIMLGDLLSLPPPPPPKANEGRRILEVVVVATAAPEPEVATPEGNPLLLLLL